LEEAMTSMGQTKRPGRLERERGIDNDHDHHLVLYKLQLLDDDDDWELFCEMEAEDDEFGDVAPELWGSYMRSKDEPSLAVRLSIACRMLQAMPDDHAMRERFVEHFIRGEYGRLEAEVALRVANPFSPLELARSVQPSPSIHVSGAQANAWASAPFMEVTDHEQLETYVSDGRDHDEIA
jgi:hypothetical protein